jgi:hypothetical protein
MKDREESNLDQSLKNMNEHIIRDDERQQHSRKMLLSKMEQEKSPKRKSWIKRSVIPVAATVLFLGTAGTLFVSEFSEQQQISEQQHEQQVNRGENNSGQGFEIGVDAKVESEIMEIKASGFDLQLPQYSPVEEVELKSIWYRDEGENDVVSASYIDREGNEVFKLMQENLTENPDINHLQENADYETEINGSTTFVSENDYGLRTINIVANKFGFTLYSYNLSEEELISIGESIK